MVKISIRLVRHFSADYEIKLHLLRYMQSSCSAGEFGNLGLRLSQLVDVVADVNGSALLTVWEHCEPRSQVSPLVLEPLEDLKLCLQMLYMLHANGIAGGISLADNRSVDDKFHDFIDPLADSDRYNELTDLSGLAFYFHQKYPSFSSDVLSDIESEEYTVFDLFQRHADFLNLPPTHELSFIRKHKIHHEYAKWKAQGKNALLEFQRENKFAYYPITQIPLLSVNNNLLYTHSNSASNLMKPATDLKDVIVDLNPNELIDAPLSASEELQHDRALRWFSNFIKHNEGDGDNVDMSQRHEFLKYMFDKTEKYQIDVNLDRQLEVDLPRCHSYHSQINSPAGQYKLKRLIKAFFKLEGNEQLVYWQGLDSIAAIFLTVFYYEDHLALYCLNEFIHRYLACFFVENNSLAVQAYLEIFQNLVGYFDPELASHLAAIEFWPDLYAIPWFLTMFSHTLSLNNLLQLWDAIFVVPQEPAVSITPNTNVKNSQVIAIFVAIAIMKVNRTLLLQSEFHDCIHVFSELNFQQDMSSIVETAVEFLHKTPPSILYKLASVLQDDGEMPQLSSDSEPRRRSSIFGSGRMRVSTIDCPDLISSSATIIDIRSSEVWTETGHLNGSLCIPCMPVMDDSMIDQKLQFMKTREPPAESAVIIGNSQENELEHRVAQQLIRMHVKGVVILRGGMDAIHANASSTQKLIICDCPGTIRNAIRQCKQ